jgi:hypothetical protein
MRLLLCDDGSLENKLGTMNSIHVVHEMVFPRKSLSMSGTRERRTSEGRHAMDFSLVTS